MHRFARPQFDENAPGFIARRNLIIGGVRVNRGELLPSNVLSTRRLRQLYDVRSIDMVLTEEDLNKTSMLIPEGWQKLPVDDLKILALEITGEEPKNRKEATKVIQDYIDGTA